MTRQDSLTGMHNRRYLDMRLEEEFTRFKRKKQTFSVLMIDIDDFKKINDTYGHQFGDLILQDIADASITVIRGSDIIARYGGEEFCVVLPDTDSIGALSFAERLRKEVEKSKTVYNNTKKVGVTVSIGIAQTNRVIKKPAELLDRADKALYISKRAGKNRSTIFKEKRK
jgi:diguanylate cyclase (GGDEF)-like protein